jgi:hypothetical protein
VIVPTNTPVPPTATSVPPTATPTSTAGPGTQVGGIAQQLPRTGGGASSSFPGFLLAAGIALVSGGLMLLTVARPRRSQS